MDIGPVGLRCSLSCVATSCVSLCGAFLWRKSRPGNNESLSTTDVRATPLIQTQGSQPVAAQSEREPSQETETEESQDDEEKDDGWLHDTAHQQASTRCTPSASSTAQVLMQQTGPSVADGERMLHNMVLSYLPSFRRWSLRQFNANLSDPSYHLSAELRRAIRDTMLTSEQQAVVKRVIDCNKNFFMRSVEGTVDGKRGLPWKRYVGLNLALLRVHHCHQASKRCAAALYEDPTCPPPLSEMEAADALRYCRWAIASYCMRSTPPPAGLSEAELAQRASEIADVDVKTVVYSQLSDGNQAKDPLCPRFLVAVDHFRSEVVLSIRGTRSFSDTMADLIGDPIPFAGGVAHGGMISCAKRLRERAEEVLRAALKTLDGAQQRRLVMTGHSLGAGVAELLAILLKGGEQPPEQALDNSSGAIPVGSWILPDDVELKTYLYAPPPAYLATHSSDIDKKASSTSLASAAGAAAAESAIACAIGFTMNCDLIPRTSLHNGFNLFQQARVVDTRLAWKKRDVVRMLGRARDPIAQGSQEARLEIALAVNQAIEEASLGAPAPPNPFEKQHPAAAQIYHIIGAPAGTTTFVDRMSSHKSFGKDDFSLFGIVDASIARDATREAPWVVYKKSACLGQWRLRHAWLESGDLQFARKKGETCTVKVPITAAATRVTLLGAPSDTVFLPSVVVTAYDEGKTGERPAKLELPSEMAFKPQTSWQFKVETSAIDGMLPVHASSVQLCTATKEARDSIVHALVASVQAARRTSYRMQPPMAPQNWGTEAVLADGFIEDHSISRYEAALESTLDFWRNT